jgi:hypothetical protein
VDRIDPWFKYIWEQFVQMNSLKTEYKLIEYSDYMFAEPSKSEVLLIEYGTKQKYSESLFIPRKNEYQTDDYVWKREDLPVYCGTILEDSDGRDYDIFYNAFVHLSRLEEWESEKNGKYIHSYSSRHPRKGKKIWKIPVVNHLFNELEEKIIKKSPQTVFGTKSKPFVEFSHDVDYLSKTVQLKIKHSLFDFFNGFKYFIKLDIPKSVSKIKKGVGFLLKDSEYMCFDLWSELENNLNIKSVYYFFALLDRKKKYNVKEWLIDPVYDIAKDSELKKKLMSLLTMEMRWVCMAVIFLHLTRTV